ncbi:DUF2306 domain-containing protein [Lacihabitans sp. LS3-19]|nr:DUF2306 domain-containing protein [Lacihabitans sp. LS3-19]
MTENTLPYFDFSPRKGFLGTKTFEVTSQAIFRIGFYVHISSALLVWLVGTPQFLPEFIVKYANWHRMLGKVYVFGILFLAAPSGLILARFANGGLSAKVGFALQCLVWWFTTFKAFKYIQEGNITQHLRYMVRSLAVTYAAFSLRTESYVMYQFLGTKPIETYLTVVWLSWVGNLLLAEIMLSSNIEKFYLKIIKPK